MGATRQPFIYEAVQTPEDERFSTSKFDPKRVTRSSYEQKAPKRKQRGPLVSVNRHPDAHQVPSGRSNHITMGAKTRAWIKAMRAMQLGLRVLELVASIGLLVLMIIITNIEPQAGWVVRITLGVAMLHSLYGIWHMSKPAGSRPPGSSAAYHVFAGVSDLCILPLYAYGVITTRNQDSSAEHRWSVLISDKSVLTFFVPSVYYGLIVAAGLHLLSLAISLWLGFMFKRISSMPPDMNPLEAHLTSRRGAHKRGKSSVASTIYGDKSVNGSSLHPTTISSSDLPRPRSIPFTHTRHESQPTSLYSRDSRLDLPSRQYQIEPGNSPRNSIADLATHRLSTPTTSSRPLSSYSSHRPPTSTVPSHRVTETTPPPTPQPRSAKFTETWYATESLVNRTHERARAPPTNPTYEPLSQPYDVSLDSDSEPETTRPRPHPNPLASHPSYDHVSTEYNPSAGASAPPPRARTPFSRLRNSVLSAVSLNDHRVSGGGQDLGDGAGSGRNRDSSIGLDSEFYAKPYGQLKPGTPPIMVGGSGAGAERVVSSGNDYDLGAGGGGMFGRRGVSGKIVEEGRAGGRW
ncbi:hypothetical protein B0T18DRAFT_371521 [Schizothecium vesticola]|uniref:Uncharacterized protein n=1 Tax=Schizothecium vesticola TaxID=314040 RepID=A0AA40EQC9_9PEZI|nr:hypothetical protein B0T18DRAFT_371521 [Schizothecium vesticola]